MAFLLPAFLILAVFFGPSLWVKWVLHRHNRERTDFPGTGGELAQHLVADLELEGVTVERTDGGSHYDPQSKTVRLEPRFFEGRSVSAVAVAAHEVGHAVQDFDHYAPLKARTQIVKHAGWVQQVARVALFAAPLAGLAGRHPGFAIASLLIGVLAMGIPVVIHLVTLPVEINASFARALPILERGEYLTPDDMPAARSVLRAAALTYVAGALVSMLNLVRWIRTIR